MLSKAAAEILARKEEATAAQPRGGQDAGRGHRRDGAAAQIFDFFAGECLRLAGELLPSVRPGIGVEITREAIGPVGLITPWELPRSDPGLEAGAGAGRGNSVVIKPADLVPGCTWARVDSGTAPGCRRGC